MHKSILTIRVRNYDCDAYGHVNNAVYLNYLEAARYEFLRDIGFDHKTSTDQGYKIYVARAEIDYKKSARMDEEITVETFPVKKGAASGILEQRITRGGEELTLAMITWAFVDKSGAPARIPAAFDVPGLKPDRP